PRFAHRLTEAAHLGMQRLLARGLGEMGAARDPRRVAADGGKDEAHSITSSARSRTLLGTVRPSAFAAFTLMTRSNFVGCSIGSSAATAPFSKRSAIAPARRYRSTRSGP